MRVVVLTSGGFDSTLMLMDYTDAGCDVAPLFVDYGQPSAKEEVAAADRICTDLGLSLYAADIRIYGVQMGKDAGPSVVPNRNGVLLAIAQNLAVNIGADAVAIGAIADDADQYEDCRGSFMKWASSQPGVPDVLAPLIQQTKQQVVRRVLPSFPSRSLYWCYEPDGPCWQCESCRAVLSTGLVTGPVCLP